MKVVYVDNSEANGAVIKHLSSDHPDVDCIVISDSKKLILHLLDAPIPPDLIIMHCGLRDVRCRALVEFIRRRSQFDQTRIVLLNSNFSAKEQRVYATLGVNQCYPTNHDINGMRLLMEHLRMLG